MTLGNRFARSTVLALVIGLLGASCGESAAADSGDADLRELSRYELTLADVRKFAAANATLAKQPKASSEGDEAGEEDEGGADGESLDDMVKRIESVPEARRAIEEAGLSVRKYALITLALFQASFAQFAVEQGADPAKVARDAGVNPANIRFVKENKAELERLQPSRAD